MEENINYRYKKVWHDNEYYILVYDDSFHVVLDLLFLIIADLIYLSARPENYKANN